MQLKFVYDCYRIEIIFNHLFDESLLCVFSLWEFDWLAVIIFLYDLGWK